MSCVPLGAVPALNARNCFVVGISDDTYHGDRSSVSSPTLKTLLSKTPAHAKADLETPRPETRALLLDRAVRRRVLEPDRYRDDFVVGPEVNRRYRDGKAEWADFLAAHPGATILNANDGATVEAMENAIAAHPLASPAFRSGLPELSGWYSDPEAGVRCRIRPDYLRADDGIMVGLRTALDVSPAAFQRAVLTQGYHVQRAMYAAGYEAITGDPLRDFLFVTVEKASPYAVAVYRIAEDALEVGLRLYRAALRTWADCLERDTWPAYSNHVESISLPPWALADLEDATHAHL